MVVCNMMLYKNALETNHDLLHAIHICFEFTEGHTKQRYANEVPARILCFPSFL